MKKILLNLVIFIETVFSQGLQVPAIQFSPEKYVCYKTSTAINIDGKLVEKDWQLSEWTKHFTDIEGNKKSAPRFDTRVKMLWDDKYFYIAAEINEPDIWATLRSRYTVIFYDNDFEVFIDPDGDTHNYTELELNALNTVWDLFLIKPYRDIEKAAVTGWDIKGLKSAVSVYGTLNKPGDKDSCWAIEIAYPWDVFKEISHTQAPPREGDQWRVNFSRVEWRTDIKNNSYQKAINLSTGKSYPEDNWVWSPQGLVNIHYPEMWGYIQFTEQNPGRGKVIFADKPEEPLKWLLRKIYYAERNYYLSNGIYTSDLLRLDIQDIDNKVLSSIKIECTSDCFLASLPFGKGSIIIDQSGLIRFINKK